MRIAFRETLDAEFESLLASLDDQDGKHHVPTGCLRSCCLTRESCREILLDSVTILDGTRKSFKSRKLGELRAVLVRALDEIPSKEI